MHLRPYTLSLVALLLASLWGSCFAMTPQEEKQSAEITGEVVVQYGEQAPFPGYAGRVFPKKDFPVYLFNWQESGAIRHMLGKLEKDIKAAKEAHGDAEKSEKWWIVEKRVEDIYKLVTSLIPSGHVRTDEKGRFVFKNLKVGEKYFVVATDLVYETGIILLDRIVGPLKPGKNEVRLVDKI